MSTFALQKSVCERTFRFDMHYKKTKRVSSLFDGIRFFVVSIRWTVGMGFIFAAAAGVALWYAVQD